MFDRMFGSAKKTKLRKQRLREAAFRRRESLFAPVNRRSRFESLEDRRLLAAFSETGNVLSIDLAANEQLAIVNSGNSYLLSLSGSTWSGTNSANATGDTLASLNVTTAGLAAFDTINIDDSGAAATVTFFDSGGVTFNDSFNVTLDDPAAGTIAFFGTNRFVGSAAINASTTANISLFDSGSFPGELSTVDGGITLSANAAGTTSGSLIGLDVSNVAIVTTGIGNISLTGSGGDDALTAAHFGVYLRGGTSVTSTASGPTAGTITIVGNGGDGSDFNLGVYLIDDTTIVTSVDGAISITGTGGNGTGNQNAGVVLENIETVSSTGTGTNAATITIDGTGGTGVDDSDGVVLFAGTTNVTSVDGAISITGRGGNGSGNSNDGVVLQDIDTVASTGLGASAATITINGTGGTGTEFNHGVFLSGNTTDITSLDGSISITGIGGNGTGNDNRGVDLSDNAAVQVNGGMLTVTGNATTGNSAGVQLNANLSVVNGGQLRSVGTGPISVTAAGNGTTTDFVAGVDSVIGGLTASGPISINADSIDFSGTLNVQSTGDLTIQPRTPSTAINLGSGATNSGLHLDSTELGFLANGFASITIGNATLGSGPVAIDNATFIDPVAIYGGSISVDNGLTGDGGTALIALDAATPGQDIHINSGTVSDVIGDVTIVAGDDFTLASGAQIVGSLPNSSVSIDVDPAPDADVGMGSTVTLGGSISSPGTGITTITAGTDGGTFIIDALAAFIQFLGSDSASRPDAVSARVGSNQYLIDNFETFIVSQVSDDLDIRFPDAQKTITLSQPSASELQANSSVGPTYRVAMPNNVLSLRTSRGGGAADTVNVSALNLTTELSISDGDATDDDTININGAITGVGFNANVLNVNVTADIDTVGAVVLGNSAANGLVTVATGSISSSAAGVQFVDDVVFTTDSAVTAAGQVAFDSAVNGPNALSVIAGTSVNFIGLVGATPLASLNVTSSGLTNISGNVTTTGPQVYNGLVNVTGAPDLSITSQNDAVTFNSTIDDAIADTTNLTISSGLVSTLGDSVGSVRRLRSLSVTSGGPMTVANLVNTLNDLSIAVTDTVGTDDDFTLTGTLASSAGNVNLNVGDDVDIQGSATINSTAINVTVDAGSADPGVGSTVILDGSLFTSLITATGGTDADTFTPRTSATFDINGGDPTTSPGDTLNIVGLGEPISLFADSVNYGNSSSTFSGIENISVSNTFGINVFGDITNDNLVLRAHPTLANTALLSLNGGPEVTFDTTQISDLSFDGSNGDDTLTLDFSNGVFATNINFNGGPNLSTNPGDQLVLTGTLPSPINQMTFNYTNANDGSVDINGQAVITYTGLEPITSSIDAANVTLSYNSNLIAEAITVTQSGTDITVDSNLGEITTFLAPTNSLTINSGGGPDIINVNGLNLATSDLTIFDTDLNDTLNFQTAPTNIGTGSLDVTVLNTNINQPLTAGSLAINSSGGTTTINTDTITTTGSQLFFDPVVLGADLVTTGVGISFGSISGGFALTVNDSSPTNGGFFGNIGGLASLTTDAAGVTRINAASVGANGPLTFNDPVFFTEPGNTPQDVGSGAAISFASTVDGSGGPITITSAGVSSFGGAIGVISVPGSGPIDALTINTAGPFVLNQNTNVTGDIAVRVTDTVADTDDLTINNAAVISSSSGSLLLSAGDDIDIQSNVTISLSSGTLNAMADQAGIDPDIGVGAIVSVAATITALGGVTLTGGNDADAFSIAPQAGTTFDVFGNNPGTPPGDVLNIDGRGADVTIDVNLGTITVPGALGFTATGVEDLSLSNMATLTIVGDLAFDEITLAGDSLVPGRDFVTVRGFNGNAPFAINSIGNLIVNGGTGDDLFQFDASLAMPTTPVFFNGQDQDGSGLGDVLSIVGTFTTQTLNFDPPGLPDGFNGTIDLDATVITYTGLEPINAGNSIDTILSFNTGAANDATLQANASPGFIEIIDNGATFENTIIPNPTNSLTVNLGDIGDTLSVNNLDGAFAASLIINGGTSTTDSVSLFSVNLVDTPGRGLTVSEVESLLMSGGSVSGNSATIGGGILINNSTSGTDTTAQISGVGIQNNIATGGTAPTEGGGGIYNNGANLTIDSGTFIFNNRATTGNASGGGVFSSGTLTINSSAIDTNFANRAGGGIEIASGSVLTTIVDSLLARNNALAGPGNGGGLHITGAGDSLIQGATITENVAAEEGGGLWNGTGVMTVIGGTVISQNRALGTLADQAGGGVFNSGGTVNLDDVQLTFNTADSGSGSGGGGFSDGGAFNVTNSTVNMNQLFGIALSNASASLTSNTFGSNGSNVGGDIGPISGTPGNDTITVSANSITIGTNTITYDATIGPLTFLGGDGDDTLIIDLSAGPLLVPISFDGGLQTTSDSISIIGGTVTDLVFNYVNANDGSIQIDTMPLVTYTGLEPITSTVTATNVVLNYSSSAETIALTQSGTDITATSSFGETTTFAAPSGNLTVNTGGGADTVVLDGLSLVLAGTLLVSDPDGPGDDIVRFQNSATTIVGGQLAVLAAMIDVTQPLSANTITLGNGSGNGLIQLGSDITTVTNLDLDNPVQLTANTTLTTGAGGATTILFEVDGPADLTIDSGSVDVRAAIGAVTRPTGFTATAQSGSIILSDVTTDGPQVYNSRVVSRLSPSLGTLDLVSTSTITFNSTIDAGLVGDSLAVIADGVLTINEAIGSSNAFDSVSLTSSVALTLNNPIAATGLLSITVSDTATVGEDLTLAAGAALGSLMGIVSLSAGDNLTIDLASSISAPGVVISVDPVTALPTDPEGSIVSVIGTISAPDFGTTISGGAEADAISIRPQTGTSFDVNGGDPLTQPGDTLNLDAGGSEATIDAGTGAFSITGRPPITPSSIEKFTILNVSTLTIVGTTGVDNVRLGTDPDTPGDDLLVVNGFTYSFSGTVGMTFNGGDEDDVFTFDATGGVPTTPVTFNGQTSNIGGSGPTTGDSLVVLGSAINQVFNYTAPGTDGNNGSVVFDSATINYTGLEPITGGNSVNTVLNFNTGATNDATLRDNSSPGFIEIIDNGSTFEDTVFPNPTGSLMINLDNTDTTLAINPLDSAFAASLVLNGSTGFAVNSTVNISDLVLSGIGGRGLDAADLDLLSIVGSTFSGNTADIGAGLRLTRSNTTIDNSTIDGNTATTTAGGIFVDGGSLAITNSFIQTNNEFGLVFSGADGTVTGNTFANNTTANLVAFPGTAGNDTFTLTNTTISDGNNTITYDGSVGPITLNGGDGDDSLIIDFSTGAIPVEINFNGEGQILGDAIVLQNGTADQITYNYVNANDGSILLRTDPNTSDLLITYTGLEPITSSLDAIDVTLNYSSASESISFTQVGNAITADSTDGETTTFVAPTRNLTLNTDAGTDTVTIDGLNLAIDGQFFITETGTPDDTVIFSGGDSTIAGSAIAGSGSLDIDAPLIQFNAGLTLGGPGTFGPASGAGQIQTTGTITAAGDLIFTEPVNLTGDTSITSTGLVRFQFSIDGLQNLIASAGTEIQFLAENGFTTPLSSLTASANTGIIRLDDFNTTGDQIYNSAVLTNAGGGTVNLVSTAGRIIFASTIDNGSSPADGLITDSDDVTEFNGTIGSIDPLDSLTVNASGDFAIANSVSVLSDVTISTQDSGTDNFVLRFPATISAPGSVTLNILDDVTTQIGSSIVTDQLTINVDDALADDDAGTGSIVLLSGAITATSGTSIVGGPDADTFNLTTQAGSQIAVDGGGSTSGPVDVLVIDAVDTDVTIDVSGVITVAGGQSVSIAGLERVDLVNIGVLTVTGDASANVFTLAGSFTGPNVLDIGLGTPITFFNTQQVVINGGDGDDVFNYDATVLAPTTPITFNGQQQTGTSGGDTLNLLGSFIDQIFNYAAPGTDGNNGSVTVSGTTLDYTGLEPINSGDSINTTLNFNTGLPNSATLRPTPTGLEIVDNGSTFEDTRFATPTNSLTINLGNSGDTLQIENINVATSLILAGGTGSDTVTIDSTIISGARSGGLGVINVETLDITGSDFINNRSFDDGAGIRVSGGTTSLNNSRIVNNFTIANGGGIAVLNGNLTITSSEIDSNQANGSGGGIFFSGSDTGVGTLMMSGVTVSGNTADDSGGGVSLSDSALVFENVTLSGNSATNGSGGGLQYDNQVAQSPLQISFSTFSDNSAGGTGGSISATGIPIDVLASIFNKGTVDTADAAIRSLGFNVDSGSSTSFNQSSDVLNTDPLLGPLADNGGPVLTHALLSGSPAIDAAGTSGPTTDARGITRPIDGSGDGVATFDSGAFESEQGFALVVDDITVNENVGSVSVTVRLPNAFGSSFTVDFATSDGTATSPSDYIATTGTLTFAGTAGETQTITIPIIDDLIVESSESFNVALSNASVSGVDISSIGVVTITDDDVVLPTVNVAVSPLSVSEDGVTNLVYTFTRTGGTTSPLTINYATSGTATAGTDFTGTNLSVVIPAGAASATVVVDPTADTTVESDETVVLTIVSNATVYTVGTASTASGIIANDDTEPATLSINDVTVNESAGTATVTVSVDNAIQGGFTVNFSTSDSTAIAPSDYFTASGTLTFAGTAGETQQFTIAIVDDAIFENAESLNVLLSNPSISAVDASATATITILDNDVAPTADLGVTISGAPSTVEVNGTVVYTVVVNNLGPDAATSVFSTTTFPAGVTITNVSATGASVSTNAGVVTANVDLLVSGASINVLITVVVGATPGSVLVSSSVTSTSDPNTANNLATTTTIVEAPPATDLSLTSDSNLPIFSGATASLDFLVSNLSTIDATSVVALFTLDPNLTFDSGSVFQGTVTSLPLTNQVRVELPSLAANESAFVTLSVTARNNLASGLTLTTNGTVSANETDSDPSNNLVSVANAVLGARTLTTGTQDGGVVLTVDALGSMGRSAIGGLSQFNPLGPIDAAETLFETAVLLGQTPNGTRKALTSGSFDGGGQIPPDEITLISDLAGTDTRVTSSFLVGTLRFDLVQELFLTLDATGTTIGSTLSQTYTITNTATTSTSFDLVRFLDADLEFDGEINDGGGVRRTANGDVLLFVTESSTLPGADTTFVGIEAIGGTTLASDRFQVAEFFPLESQVIAGAPLNGTVTGDLEGDELIDAGQEYDVSLALRNLFQLAAGASTTYETNTFFGSGPISPRSSITGHVFCDANGSGAEEAGEAEGNVTVFVDLNGNRVLDANELSTLTNVSGDFFFSDVAAGAVTVAVVVPDGCNTIPSNVGVARTSLDAGKLARSIATVDLDGDLDMDLVIASDLSNSVTIFQNNGGVFSIQETVTLSDRPQAISAWSPGSGSRESVIAVAGFGTPSNKGNVFKIADEITESFKAGDGPIALVVDDFNGDSIADIVSVASRSSDLSLTLGREPTSSDSSTVGASQILTGVRNIRAIITGDFNGDGKTDIAAAGLGFGTDANSELKVLLGRGNGTFDTAIARAGDREIVDLVATDIDSDGNDELLTLSATGQLKTYRLSALTLSQIAQTSVSIGASSFAVGDFNGDGMTDVAVANLGDELIELLVGDHTGQFFVKSTVTNVTAPSDIVVADFDGDGKAEIAVANFYKQLPEIVTDQTPRNKLPSTLTILKLNIAEQAVMVTSESTSTVNVTFPSANPATIFDVNRDSFVSAVDALEVISVMRQNDLALLSNAESEQAATHKAGKVVFRAPQRVAADVNGDGRTSALDALMVINYLNQQQLEQLLAATGESLATQSLAYDSPKVNKGDEDKKRVAAIDALFAGGLF